VKPGVLYRRAVTSPRTFLSGITVPTEVSVEAVVASEDAVSSPLTGARAALVRIDVVESDRPIGSVVLGDTLVLSTADGAITLVARRATLVFFDRCTPASPLASAPPEIVALLRRATGSGALAFHEHRLARGGRVVLRAWVEASGEGRKRSFVVRHDLGAVTVEEIVSG
jgi:hypothetical protein